MAEHLSIFHEEKTTLSLSPKNEKALVTKTFRFLEPCTKDPNQAVQIPKNPLLYEIFPRDLPRWPSKVEFKGWRLPQKRWEEWIDRLRGDYSALWTQVGIHEAILSSAYVVHNQDHLVLALSEFWCSETNTCVFPWGESTISLEDVMILGGFPVLGESVKTPLDQDMMNVERELEKQRSEMCKSRSKKADQSAWMNYFMDKKGELEHAAFLSLWLSRYVFVFPSHSQTVGNVVFSIAVKLSRGIKVALGPTVLASIYRDLRLLREGVIANKESITIYGAFQLVHLWVFEHFPLLRPKTLNYLKQGEPRVACWHKLRSTVQTLPHARSILADIGNFEWRPYATNMTNWRQHAYYGEKEQTHFLNKSSLDSGLTSFFRCVSVHEVVGLHSVEDYSPHRIARQFGYDQDLPSGPTSFEMDSDNVKFFVPPRFFRGRASERYTTWFKEMMFNRHLAIQSILKKENFSTILKPSSSAHANSDFPREINSKKEFIRTFEINDGHRHEKSSMAGSNKYSKSTPLEEEVTVAKVGRTMPGAASGVAIASEVGVGTVSGVAIPMGVPLAEADPGLDQITNDMGAKLCSANTVDPRAVTFDDWDNILADSSVPSGIDVLQLSSTQSSKEDPSSESKEDMLENDDSSIQGGNDSLPDDLEVFRRMEAYPEQIASMQGQDFDNLVRDTLTTVGGAVLRMGSTIAQYRTRYAHAEKAREEAQLQVTAQAAEIEQLRVELAQVKNEREAVKRERDDAIRWAQKESEEAVGSMRIELEKLRERVNTDGSIWAKACNQHAYIAFGRGLSMARVPPESPLWKTRIQPCEQQGGTYAFSYEAYNKVLRAKGFRDSNGTSYAFTMKHE